MSKETRARWSNRFYVSPGGASYPRAGGGPPPDGMPLSVWDEAGRAGLFYIGRDANGEWRFTLDPGVSEVVRRLFPSLYPGISGK